MATKSDFAQKLLSDLRLRKERMAVSEHSSRQPTSRGNLRRASNASQQMNAREYTGYRTGSTSRRSTGSSRSINIKESENSSQIVLYENGQSSRQIRDLTMAIAFAFENGGNLTKIGTSSSSNPLVNFFNRFGRRSMGNQKMDLTNLSISLDQFPNVSNFQIGEISKGVQKLNQILRACSNGFNLDRNSIEVGKELLKGAIDLEESLRILVNLQESSRYGNQNASQNKSRLKLLDEDEDDQDDNNDKAAEQWKLDRPRFSFDKPSRNSYANKTRDQNQLALSYPNTDNSKMGSHRRSMSHVQDLSLCTQVKYGNSNSSQLMQDKGRISNVIAKLMGLEELPQKGKEGKLEKSSHGNINNMPEHPYRDSGKGSRPNTDKRSSLANDAPPYTESQVQLKSEKSRDITGGISKVTDQKQASSTLNKKLRHAGSGLQNFEDGEKRKNHTKDKASRLAEVESNKSLISTVMQQTAQKNRAVKAEGNANANAMEKRNLNRDLPGNQQKPQDESVILQDHMPKRNEHTDDRRRADQRGQKPHKQNFMAKKQEEPFMEMTTATRSKKSTLASVNKLSRNKPAVSTEKSVKPSEKHNVKDPENRRNQNVVPVIGIAEETTSSQENLKKEDQSHDPFPGESQVEINNESSNQELIKVRPIGNSGTQMKIVPQKVQKREIPQKIDELITRRNASTNHLARSRKQPANILKDLKQIHSKNRSSRSTNQQSGGKAKQEKDPMAMQDGLEINNEQVSQRQKLQDKPDQTILLTSHAADEYLMQNIPHQKDKYDAKDINSGKVSDALQSTEESCTLKDEQGLTECDQTGDHEEDINPFKHSQLEHKQGPVWARQEPLTESEMDLKEILIKSQLFLSTAEALFKLNLPLSFLHIGDHDDVVAKKKQVLDCAYEVMKRKARRHEISFHPYQKNSKSYTKVWSLDNMVKQLSKDIEMLKFYGSGNGGEEYDVAVSLHTMLNNDIHDKNPDINCMWDLEWSQMTFMFPEKNEVIRDIERHMLNGLLDEITNDLLPITVSL